MSLENWDMNHGADRAPPKKAVLEFTQAEIKLLRLGVLAVEREDVSRGGSRDYSFEDQITALKDKLRDASDAEET